MGESTGFWKPNDELISVMRRKNLSAKNLHSDLNKINKEGFQWKMNLI